MSEKRFVNKKGYHDYEILQTYEAGIKLLGPEVKSIRNGGLNLKGNFVHEWRNSLWVEAMHISKYKFSTHWDVDPFRKRELLLNKKEIEKITSELKTKGISCIVLEIYFKKSLVKAKIATVRGKKLHDKRETLKQKDQERQMNQAIKAFIRSR